MTHKRNRLVAPICAPYYYYSSRSSKVSDATGFQAFRDVPTGGKTSSISLSISTAVNHPKSYIKRCTRTT